jgi:hypothetical protein
MLQTEKRTGGDIEFIKEINRTDIQKQIILIVSAHRFYLIITLMKEVNSLLKIALITFSGSLNLVNYAFSGTQTGTFTEATYSNHGERSEWMGGINW